MKQSKKAKNEKEKENYSKATFLIPVVTSVLDAILVCAGMYIYSNGSASNVEFARLMGQMSMILITFSPTLLMMNALISHRHMKKHPDSSAFYSKAPMILSIIVFGVQVLYMATFTGV